MGDYFLSFLVRGDVVNGIPYYLPSQVYDAINEAKSVDSNFDEAKNILWSNTKSIVIDYKYVMYSSRCNLINLDWNDKALRAVIDITLIGKDIPKKKNY